MQYLNSFRDPMGTLLFEGKRCYRFIRAQHQPAIEKLITAEFFTQLQQQGSIIQSQKITAEALPKAADAFVGELCLEHPHMEYISYPWEWCFSALKDAGLLTLELQATALLHGYSLKDASAANIIFAGTKPVFVDILSFTPYQEGRPWLAYGQFLRNFLFPLWLQAYADLPFQELSLTHLGELPLDVVYKILGTRHFVKPLVFSHVFLQQKLAKLMQNTDVPDLLNEKSLQLSKKQLLHQIQKLKQHLTTLRYKPLQASSPQAWIHYAGSNSYAENANAQKQATITSILATERPYCLLDFGANSGIYTNIAAQYAQKVIAVEMDPAVSETLYLNAAPNVYPFVCNVAKPTPALGFALQEKLSFPARVHGDMFLALALIHHLRISAGIPLTHIIPYLLSYAPKGILEWIAPEDPQVLMLLKHRENVFLDYSFDSLLSILKIHCLSWKILTSINETRTLIFIQAKVEGTKA